MEFTSRDIVAEGVALNGPSRHVGQFVGMVAGRMLAKIGERADVRGEALAWTTATVAVSRYAPQEWQITASVLTDDAAVPQAVNDGTVSPAEHWKARAVGAEHQVGAALDVLRAAGASDPVARRVVAILTGVEDEDPGSPWRHG